MPTIGIVIYGTSWCGACYRARKILDQYQIGYRWVNIDSDVEGDRLVKHINHGMRSVPTIIFEDGSVLVEPAVQVLVTKLAQVDLL